MPRIRADKDRYWKEDFLKAVRIGMAKQGIRSFTVLARKAGIPRSTLTRKLNSPMTLTLEDIQQIRRVIPLDPEIILQG